MDEMRATSVDDCGAAGTATASVWLPDMLTNQTTKCYAMYGKSNARVITSVNTLFYPICDLVAAESFDAL